MKVLVFQHEPNEGIGNMASWMASHEAELTYVKLFEPNPAFPPVKEFDLVIVLGGLMSVNDEDDYAWLKTEKSCLAEVLENGTPLLGLCLGAQMIANVLGADVVQGEHQEIGWYPVDNVSKGQGVQITLPKPVFHWHGETFKLPDGAVRLMSSQACENQAFQMGEKVVGLQYHLEVIPDTIEHWLHDVDGKLPKGPYIQSVEELQKTPAAFYEDSQKAMERLLDYLVS